jgi:thiamine transporter ThiT
MWLTLSYDNIDIDFSPLQETQNNINQGLIWGIILKTDSYILQLTQIIIDLVF